MEFEKFKTDLVNVEQTDNYFLSTEDEEEVLIQELHSNKIQLHIESHEERFISLLAMLI